MAAHLIRRVRDRQPTRHVGIDVNHPMADKVLDAWLPVSINRQSCRNRRPLSIVNVDYSSGVFGQSVSARGGGQSVKYNVGSWGQAGTFAFVAICEFFDYASTVSVVRRDGAFIPVQIALSTVRSVAWDPVDGDEVYYSTSPGWKIGVLVANRISQSTQDLWVDGVKVKSTSGLTGYGSTSNPLCFLGTESDYELATIGAVKFYGGIAFKRGLSDSEIISISKNPWQLFAPETIPLFFSTVTAQYARPTSDVSAGTWTASSGSDLYAMLDETAASDADYITTSGTSTCEVALTSLSDPASSAGHIVRYRISADSGGITVRLRQGTTTIATWTHASAPTSLTTYEQTLTGGEADSISDYSALRLQFEAT